MCQVAPARGETGPDVAVLPQPLIVTGHYDIVQGAGDAASAGMVNGDLLRDMPLLRPGEALETIPGLIVTQHSGDGKANQYFLRGYNLDHGTDFATAIDGVPVNMPSNAHGQGYSDINFLIPELVDRITYRKGPYFAENGDFSAAGSADIRYRNTLDGGSADLTSGSHDYQRLLLMDAVPLTGVKTGLRLLGALEVMHENGPWVVPEDLRKTNAVVRLSNGNTAYGWSIDAIHYRAQWNSTDQVPLALIESGQLARFGALDPTDGGNTGRDIVSGEWHRQAGTSYTRLNGFYEHSRLQLWSDFSFYEDRHAQAPAPDLPSDQFEQREVRDVSGGQLVQGWHHRVGAFESTSEAGLQLRHDAIDVALRDTQSRVAFATVSDDHVNQTSLGSYARNTTIWTPWLRSVAGLRIDAIWMDRLARVTPENSGHASASQVSPKGDLIFGPFKGTELFVSAGRGFHSNDARGVIASVDPTTGGSASAVPALVSAFGKEIGMRSNALPGFQTAVAVWSLNSASELIYNADSDIGSTIANGASRRWGVEWNSHVAHGTWLLFDADLAWTHARFAQANANDVPGNRIPNAVPLVARLGTTVHHGDRWSVTAEERYFAAYPLTQDASETAPSTFVTNLRLATRPLPMISVNLEVLNLFDSKYYDIAYDQDYQVSPTARIIQHGITVHPGEPRQFRIGLHTVF